MSFGALVVHAASDADGTARVALAAALAGRFGAALLGVAARDVPLPLAPAPAGVAAMETMLDEQEAEIRQELAAAEQDVRAAAGQGVPGSRWKAAVASGAGVRDGSALTLGPLPVTRGPAATAAMAAHEHVRTKRLRLAEQMFAKNKG